MPEYLVLMKLNPEKVVDAVRALRGLPEKPVSGVDLCYTMNIFGDWDVGVWIDAANNRQAMDFVQRRVKSISGVADIHTVPAFPHGESASKTRQEREEESE